VPTYQYSCTECAHAFEQFQSFTDDALTECPQCQGRLRKLFNAVGVVFKGSGFYRNDSRTGAGTAEGSSSDSGDTGAAASKDSPPSKAPSKESSKQSKESSSASSRESSTPSKSTASTGS